MSADEGDPDGDTTASIPKSSTGGLPYRIHVSNISDEDAERASRESPIEIQLPQIKVKPSAPPLKAKVPAPKSRKLEGHFAPPPALFPGPLAARPRSFRGALGVRARRDDGG